MTSSVFAGEKGFCNDGEKRDELPGKPNIIGSYWYLLSLCPYVILFKLEYAKKEMFIDNIQGLDSGHCS